MTDHLSDTDENPTIEEEKATETIQWQNDIKESEALDE